MGICLSCFGDDASERDYRNQGTERTPLLQDPTAILQQPRPEPTPEGQQRDQEALKKIVERTAESLINIQSTFDRRKQGQDMEASDRAAHCKYLVERLRNKESGSSLRSHTDSDQTVVASDDQKSTITKNKTQLVLSKTEVTNEEHRLLDASSKILEDAITKLQNVSPVGDVVVKLTWDR